MSRYLGNSNWHWIFEAATEFKMTYWPIFVYYYNTEHKLISNEDSICLWKQL